MLFIIGAGPTTAQVLQRTPLTDAEREHNAILKMSSLTAHLHFTTSKNRLKIFIRHHLFQALPQRSFLSPVDASAHADTFHAQGG